MSEWIDAKILMPKNLVRDNGDSVKFLCRCHDWNSWYQVLEYDNESGFWIDMWCDEFRYNVSHWMEIPEIN